MGAVLAAKKPHLDLDNCSDSSRLSKNERMKDASAGLFYVSDGKKEPVPFRDEVDALTRGETDTLSNEAKELSKFMGAYGQANRVDKTDRFLMVRIRNPGGVLTAAQWVALDDATERYADGTLRLTSRQAIQYHHVYGTKIAGLMRHLHEEYLPEGTLGGCGDVNRNLMCSPIEGLAPGSSSRGLELAGEIAAELLPRTSAYVQIWAEDEPGAAPRSSEEPIYGKLYMPRKFKIGIARPNDNSVDLLTQDIGLMPVEVDGVCDGEVWDLHSGGGLGFKHGKQETQPYLGLFVGRVHREQVLDAVRAIVFLQRDFGERKDRQQARWKYTIRRLGLDSVRQSLRDKYDIDLETEVEPQAIPRVELHHGWHEQADGKSYFGLPVMSGRMDVTLRKAVRSAVEQLGLRVVLTPQQDLLLCDVEDRAVLEAILSEHGVALASDATRFRNNAMACPSLPTCPLGMTESERALPGYADAIEVAGLGDIDVVMRMTGCPNNCARPVSAEIGIYGYGKAAQVLTVGGSREGTRLGRALYDKLPTDKVTEVLVALLRAVKDHKPDGVSVGDFLHETDHDTIRGWVGVEI